MARSVLISFLSVLASFTSVFASPLTAQEILLASVDENGDQVSGSISRPFISGNGRYVVFLGSGFTSEDDNALLQVFRHDLVTGDTILISRADGAAGAVASSGTSLPRHAGGRAITDDGNLVVFKSDAANLPDATGDQQIYVRDVLAGTTTLVSQNNAGSAGNGQSGLSDDFAIAPDGWAVVFNSLADNLDDVGSDGDVDMDGLNNTYLRDITGLAANPTRLACFDYLGNKIDDCSYLSLSCTGILAYQSATFASGDPDANMGAGQTSDNYAGPDLFYAPALDDSPTRITEDYDDGPASTPGSSINFLNNGPVISCDGEIISFITTADLSLNDQTDGVDREPDLYVHDVNTAIPSAPGDTSFTSNLQRLAGGTEGTTLDPNKMGMSSDGQWITFTSDDAFDPGDTGFFDVYTLRYFRSGTNPTPILIDAPVLATIADAGGNAGNGNSDLRPTVSNLTSTAFQANTTALLPPGGDTNGAAMDAFVALLELDLIFADDFESGGTTAWAP